MIVKVSFETSDNIYEIPLSKVLKFLKGLSEEDFETACKKVLAQL